MVTKKELEEMLARSGGATRRRYGHLVPCLKDLYQLGLTINELEQLFPVSKKWIRTQFGPDFPYRGPGVRTDDERPTADDVIRVLKKHGLSLEKLTAMEPAVKRRKRGETEPKRRTRKAKSTKRKRS